jgi:hypothetical protein
MATSVINDADVALARAHAAEGEKYATYETTLADLYLVKAREEQGHAHYAEAKELAAEALKHATAATNKAAERRATAPAPTVPTATVQRPDVAAPAPAPAPKPATPIAPSTPTPAAPTQPAPERKPKSPIDPGNLQ